VDGVVVGLSSLPSLLALVAVAGFAFIQMLMRVLP
jgi:hypothetical protein